MQAETKILLIKTIDYFKNSNKTLKSDLLKTLKIELEKASLILNLCGDYHDTERIKAALIFLRYIKIYKLCEN